MATSELPVVVIGAGIAGLAAAVELAARGRAVTVLERAPAAGGKLREARLGAAGLDAGPTVLTLRAVFEELFSGAGVSLDSRLTLTPVGVLARHAWNERERLDLYADVDRSAEAIGEFASAAEARRFLAFVARARSIYQTLEHPFIRRSPPSVVGLIRDAGLRNLGALAGISPFRSLWSALGDHFRDARLRQLFARYATYVGSSPFQAPATLMLLAHVEQAGVWLVEGGMQRIASAVADLAAERGVTFRYEAEAREVLITHGRASGVELADGERMSAAAVIVNADVSAVAGKLFGTHAARDLALVALRERSLSAVTWSLLAATEGFPLARHTVFFSSDYAREFDELFNRGRLPTEPTVYVCAQDRDDRGQRSGNGPERLLCLVNAPPTGDRDRFTQAEIQPCEERTFALLARCGLKIERTAEHSLITTPADFHARFPGSGGALYGRASHGWRASFQRPGVRSPLPGMYLAGGSVHPGPGVPMAALSGMLAARQLLADSGSTAR